MKHGELSTLGGLFSSVVGMHGHLLKGTLTLKNISFKMKNISFKMNIYVCLLYTSDAADE